MNEEEKAVEEKAVSTEDLQRQIEAIKKSQAGSDAKVAELLKENGELRAKLGEAEGLDLTSIEQLKKFTTTLKTREAVIAQRERLLERAIQNDIEPALAIKLAGLTAEESDTNFDALLAEIEKLSSSKVKSVLASSGGKPGSGTPELSLSEFRRMSPDERARLPRSVRERLARNAI
jgi:predicted RNase H-like nuclease (RuvC/YqgF family)